MPPPSDQSKMSVRQFAERFRTEMIPLSRSISYYCAPPPLPDEDLKEYLTEPVAALPPALAALLPKVAILLVPYLERGNGERKTRSDAPEMVAMSKPSEGKSTSAAHLQLGDETVLVFALKELEMAEYHYRLYHALASVMSDRWSAEIEGRYGRLLREELSADVHGEVDEQSWRLKQGLRRTKSGALSATGLKAFKAYARQSFADTLTLYLHGICCDIDVETGPRQLPSRHLRKRLMLLEEMFPPPQGYAVFPEQLEA